MMSRLLLVLTSIVGILHVRWVTQRLSGPLATRFGVDGSPIVWSEPSQVWIVSLVTYLAVPALLVTLVPILKRMPNKFINIPNREHHLAPEKRDQTFSFVSSWLAWVGMSMNIFFILIWQEIYRANQLSPIRLTGVIWIYVVFFMLITLGEAIYLAVHFSKKD